MRLRLWCRVLWGAESIGHPGGRGRRPHESRELAVRILVRLERLPLARTDLGVETERVHDVLLDAIDPPLIELEVQLWRVPRRERLAVTRCHRAGHRIEVVLPIQADPGITHVADDLTLLDGHAKTPKRVIVLEDASRRPVRLRGIVRVGNGRRRQVRDARRNTRQVDILRYPSRITRLVLGVADFDKQTRSPSDLVRLAGRIGPASRDVLVAEVRPAARGCQDRQAVTVVSLAFQLEVVGAMQITVDFRVDGQLVR